MLTNLLNLGLKFRANFLLGLLAVYLPITAFSKEKSVVLALGDSLTAGFGVNDEDSYPSQLQLKITSAGYPYKVVNAGVSGDTTAGGVRRIQWLMKHNPSIVILALGANDGLRGLSVDEMRKNLETMIQICRKNNAKILMAGMKTLPNYGKDYMQDFETVFHELAKQYDLNFLPFLLEGVAGERVHTQPDGLHPVASGYRIITDLVWEQLEPMLKKNSS